MTFPPLSFLDLYLLFIFLITKQKVESDFCFSASALFFFFFLSFHSACIKQEICLHFASWLPDVVIPAGCFKPENPCVHFVERGLSFSPSDLSSSPHPIAPAMLSSWLFLCTSGLLLSRAFVWVVPSARITLLSHPEGLYASPDHPAEGATRPLRCAVLFLPGFSLHLPPSHSSLILVLLCFSLLEYEFREGRRSSLFCLPFYSWCPEQSLVPRDPQ